MADDTSESNASQNASQNPLTNRANNQAQRDAKGRLLPGARLTSPGRPVGLVKYISDRTNDGKTLVDRFLDIWEGKEPGFKARERMEAGKWLGDRLWGKAVDVAVVASMNPDSPEASALREMSSEVLMRLAQLMKAGGNGTSTVATPNLPKEGLEIPTLTRVDEGLPTLSRSDEDGED